MMDETIVNMARDKATKWHNEVNHVYDGKYPYALHLQFAAMVGRKYISLIPADDRAYVLAAIWLHDVLEDTRKTYNDLNQRFSTKIANLVYAVTNEKGRSREERANARYYKGVNDSDYGVFVKLCDRIANMLYGVMFGGGMIDKCKKELDHFLNSLNTEGYEVMVQDLQALLEYKIFNFTPIDEVKGT